MLLASLLILIFFSVFVLSIFIVVAVQVSQKIFFLNYITNLCVVIFLIMSIVKNNQSYIDITLIYLLMNYVGSKVYYDFFTKTK